MPAIVSDKPVRFLNLLGHFGLTEEMMDICLADEAEAEGRMKAFLAPLPERMVQANATDDLLIQHAWTHVDSLPLKTRVLNCLSNRGIRYIWELASASKEKLDGTRGFGPDALKQTQDALADLGLKTHMATAHLQDRIRAAKPANITYP